MTSTVLEAARVSSFNQFSLHICSLKKLPNSMRLEKFDSITRARATLKKCVKAEAVSNLPVESKQPWAKGPKEGVHTAWNRRALGRKNSQDWVQESCSRMK